MKIAIMADIHGNKDALQAVLTDINNRGIQSIYNLGDSLYGPLFPLETYDLLMNQNIQSIKGNCDRILLEPNTSNSTVQYVQNLLEDEQKTWISNLPNFLQTDDFYFCHGTPTSDEMYLLEEMSSSGSVLKKTEDITKLVSDIPQRLIFCAHTHIPRVIYLPNDKIIINPGSVGLPAYEDELPIYHKMESGSPFANYTIVKKQEENWMIEQLHIPYNRDGAISKSEKNGRLDWARALKTGRI
ncbi:metallophosphoesterase family protein [Bacillus bingmayongensis]|uniref:metallophosphoesterase family protein n=1 Tax=Bacillus bingmayongensis TaxID=1150157 RepID=UPI001C8D19BA|nr:metallophosphoesterase family protein [Bacillus bingmayongensis]MBY0599936.1 metallophosphatase family protein [Bacillus bingmayongensis]